jgi:hypothetical protein
MFSVWCSRQLNQETFCFYKTFSTDSAKRSLVVGIEPFTSEFILSRNHGHEMFLGYERSHACHHTENTFIARLEVRYHIVKKVHSEIVGYLADGGTRAEDLLDNGDDMSYRRLINETNNGV